MFEPDQVPPRCEFEMEKLVIQLDEVLPSNVEVIDPAVAKIIRLVKGLHCWEDPDSIDLALREALVNAIVHGNHSDPRKAVRVCVALQPDCGVIIVVKDAGSGFDPNQLPNPVMGENLFADHGRGIFLINQLMDDVHFSFDRGTSIYMRRSGTPKS